jgi:tRNA threonylcarbamoyladenosine biosynthesis protein TsaE
MTPGKDISPASVGIPLPDEAATLALARSLTGLLQAGDVVFLIGDLGAGKTTFARGLINALPPAGDTGAGDSGAGDSGAGDSGAGDTGVGDTGVGDTGVGHTGPDGVGSGDGAGDEEVPSPTFTLVQIYERRPAPIWHVDLYRLERPEEVEELGLEEAAREAITLIEWPDRLGQRIPVDRLEVQLSYGEDANARSVVLTGYGSWRKRLSAIGSAARPAALKTAPADR